MEKKLAEYKCDTNEAVCLKLGGCIFFYIECKQNMTWMKQVYIDFVVLFIRFPLFLVLTLSVRFPEDVDDDSTTFHPEYTHQLFGDE